jgi:hypothetical protein
MMQMSELKDRLKNTLLRINFRTNSGLDLYFKSDINKPKKFKVLGFLIPLSKTLNNKYWYLNYV